MGLLEILLIFAGIAICIISFRIPAKREEQLEETKELAKAEIRELVTEQLSHVQETVEGTVDETITYAVEKTERFMERMSNEKIMAINEYSDTVMEDIHKSHTEVMFLYDMLNEKHENIKNTAVEVNKAMKAAKSVRVENVSKENEEVSFSLPSKVTHDVQKETVNKEEVQPEAVKQSAIERLNSMAKDTEKRNVEQPMPEVELSFANMGMENNNEEILRLHREGKSNVTIAQELGLGVGEVKLVIDLFEGM